MKRRVRIKPTRTERRQRLARALEETGLKDRGVRLESDAPLKPAPSREWRGRAQTPREKRALSMPRTPGRIDADGPFAQALVDALRAAQTDDVIAESLTHPVHAYPARMHPATARALIELVMHDRDGTLVDPFCGSGTTLVEARAAGVRAFGCDLNPLAVRLARAKTWTAPAPRRRALRDAGRSIAAEALAAGRAARRAAGAPPMPLRGPAGFDPNARNKRLARWFAPHVRRELELIAARIDELRADDEELAIPLEVCLSAILYKVSSRASDTDPTWVERNVARGNAARLFAQRVEMLCAGLDDLARIPGIAPEVIEADARSLAEKLGAGNAAGLVTSPPYAGTYDYAEQHRLRFDFLGLRHRNLDEGEIGARRSFGTPDGDRRWRAELAQVLAMIETILAPNARAALVIGDSIAGGRAMYADDDLRAALPRGLALHSWASQDRPMLGAAERRAFEGGGRPKREHIALVVKAGPGSPPASRAAR